MAVEKEGRFPLFPVFELFFTLFVREGVFRGLPLERGGFMKAE